jgi:hypothetical protein
MRGIAQRRCQRRQRVIEASLTGFATAAHTAGALLGKTRALDVVGASVAELSIRKQADIVAMTPMTSEGYWRQRTRRHRPWISEAKRTCARASSNEGENAARCPRARMGASPEIRGLAARIRSLCA